MGDGTGSPQTTKVVPAVVQATKILRAMMVAPRGLTVTSASRETGISQSTCFNILRTLVQERILNFNPGEKTYSLGLGLIEIASAAKNLTSTDIIRPELSEIAGSYNALMTLWKIIDNGRMVLLDRVAAPRAVHIDMRIGQRLPALSGAVGRSVAAQLQLSARQLRKQFDALIWENAPTFESFAADIRQAKEDGYALDCGHWLRGINAVGSAVCDSQGMPRMGIGALTLTGQHDVSALKRLGQDLFMAKNKIEKSLYLFPDQML